MIPLPKYWTGIQRPGDRYFFVLRYKRELHIIVKTRVKPEPLDHTLEGLTRYF